MNSSIQLRSHWISGFALMMVACLVSSCAIAPITIAPVGPQRKAGGMDQGVGQLVVYTATEEKQVGKMVRMRQARVRFGQW